MLAAGAKTVKIEHKQRTPRPLRDRGVFFLHELYEFVQNDEKYCAGFLDMEKTCIYNEVSSFVSRTAGGENSRLTGRQNAAQDKNFPRGNKCLCKKDW